MLMRADNGAVNHHVFIVMIRSEMAEYPFDHTSFTPAAQSPVHVFPVPKTARKIPPRDACTVAIRSYPEFRVFGVMQRKEKHHGSTQEARDP